MLSFLTRSEPSRGLVFFRGRTPHRPEEYQFLTKLGVSGKLGKRSDAAHWTLELSHKQWGSASLIALRDIPMPDAATVQYSAGLSDQDRTEMAGAGWAVALTAPASRGHVLRDRKNFLRYLRAVMGTDALMSVDSQSMLFWPRGRLDDELQHDADLDVEALYCIHAVSDRQGEEEAPIPWVHTHGLGELGAYDFDILNCHPAVGSVSGGDLFRGIAFSLLEGELKPGAEVLVRAPGSPVRAVEAGEFQVKAHAPDAALREHDEAHASRRVVLCDPMPGFLGRLLRGTRPRPSGMLQSDPEGCIIGFSHAATDLMAQRARLTAGLFGQFLSEFAEFKPVGLAKIACATSKGGREHPWFSVHEVGPDRIDGTLENDPFDIPGLRKGERYTRPLEDLTDWMIMLPMGSINPRHMSLASMVRQNPDKAREVLAMLRAMPQE